MQVASDYFPLLKLSNFYFASGRGWISNLYDVSGWWLGYRIIHGNEEYGLTITSYDRMRREVSAEMVRFSLQNNFYSSSLNMSTGVSLRREFGVIDHGLVNEDLFLENGDLLRHQIWTGPVDRFCEPLSLQNVLEDQDWHVQIQDSVNNDVGERVTHLDPSHFLVKSANFRLKLYYLEHFRPIYLKELYGNEVNKILNRYKLLDSLENIGRDPNSLLTKEFLVIDSPYRFDEHLTSAIKNRSRFY